MRIKKSQLLRIIREAGRSEHDAEARGMAAAYRQGYNDAYRGPGFKRRGGGAEYRRGYEKGVVDVEQGKPPPDDFRPARRIREAEGSTKKYDDDSALKGGQSKLPDGLQKGIIDKTVEDREEREAEEKEEKNESLRMGLQLLRKIIRESLEEENLYVVIGNAGHGRQTMWPKSAKPGVYSRVEAEKIAKEQGSQGLAYGSTISWHAQPLSRELLGGRFGVQPGNEAYIGLEQLIQDYEGGGVWSDEEDDLAGYKR